MADQELIFFIIYECHKNWEWLWCFSHALNSGENNKYLGKFGEMYTNVGLLVAVQKPREKHLHCYVVLGELPSGGSTAGSLKNHLVWKHTLNSAIWLTSGVWQGKKQGQH